MTFPWSGALPSPVTANVNDHLDGPPHWSPRAPETHPGLTSQD